jgi:hypothetical protein
MGTHVADTVEELAQLSALAASRRTARKREIAEIGKIWRSVRDLLPQEERRHAVDDALEQVEYHGPIMGRLLFEALAKYALWYEGYSFSR